MKLDDIWKEWNTDSNIDETQLDKESLNIPKLHKKYTMMLSNERLILIQLEQDYKVLTFPIFEYISGSLDLKELKERGYEKAFGKTVLRGDMEKYYDSYEEVRKLSLRIGLQKEKIAVLDSILDNIKNRGYHISAAINFKKFENGGY